jgi:hypothetical protein
MQKNLFSFLFFLVIITMLGCNAINPKEELPTYIVIDSTSVMPTIIEKHGSVSHKITDVWVYYNRTLLGTYELPAKIPILAKGKGELTLVAGIWENGLSGTRSKYPFYAANTLNFEAKPTEIIHHHPVFNYRDAALANVTYSVEDFEQGNGFIKLSGDTSVVRTNLPNEVFEGSWSGKILLKDTIKNVETITSQIYSLGVSKEAYLEMNYKSDIPFAVKVKASKNGSYYFLDIISLKAKNVWNKTYLNIGGFGNAYQGGQFQFYIQANLPSGQTEGKLLIDNFKVIRYN